MMLGRFIYAEYIERDRFMPLEIFRHLGDQLAWTDPENSLVGSFGRTMRLGRLPAYMAFWKCKGMKRLDEWEAHFNSPAAAHDHAEHATHRAIHLQYAGCYDEVIEGPAVDRNGLHCIEYFGAAAKIADAALAAHFQARAARHPAATLNFVLRRIGQLGPDPGHLSVWSFASYEALEPFARVSLDDDLPCRWMSASIRAGEPFISPNHGCDNDSSRRGADAYPIPAICRDGNIHDLSRTRFRPAQDRSGQGRRRGPGLRQTLYRQARQAVGQGHARPGGGELRGDRRNCSGRIVSYAQLLYAGNVTDPEIGALLPDHAGAGDRDLAPTCCSSPWS